MQGACSGTLIFKSNTPMQASRYLTLAAVGKWTCQHVRLARCPQEWMTCLDQCRVSTPASLYLLRVLLLIIKKGDCYAS